MRPLATLAKSRLSTNELRWGGIMCWRVAAAGDGIAIKALERGIDGLQPLLVAFVTLHVCLLVCFLGFFPPSSACISYPMTWILDG